MSLKSSIITSGAWQRIPHMVEYRSELLDDLLVERSNWDASTPEQQIAGSVIAAPGYVWFRFWFAEGEQMIEKYFDQSRGTVGYFMPISTTWRRKDTHWSASDLLLAIWLDVAGRVTVLNEEKFEQASAAGIITPLESEHAEQRMRRLTLAISQKRFPPPLVRNFSI